MRNKKGQFTSGERKVNQFGYTLYFTETEKECRKCNKIKVHSDFHKETTNKYGLAYWCKECACANGRMHHARRMIEDPLYAKQSATRYRKQQYELTSEEYDNLWKEQKYCSICKVELLGRHQTHLDHDHKTGKLRDFLCTNCNRGLGHFQDSILNLQKAIEYLHKHNSNVAAIKEGTGL